MNCKLLIVTAAVLAVGFAADVGADPNPDPDPSNVTPQNMEKDAKAIYDRIADVLNAVAIGIGAAMAVGGYRYKKITFFVIGFCVAGGIAFVAVDTLTDGTTYQSWAPVTALALGGLAVGLITGLLVKVGIFASGAGLGVVLAMLLQQAALFRVTSLPPNVLMYICMGVFGLVLGLVALKLERLIVILATSFGGMFLAVYGIGHFAGNLPSPFNLSQTIDGMAAKGVDSVPTVWWVYVGIICATGALASLLQHYVIAKKAKKGGAYVGQGADREYIVLESGLAGRGGDALLQHETKHDKHTVVSANSLVYA